MEGDENFESAMGCRLEDSSGKKLTNYTPSSYDLLLTLAGEKVEVAVENTDIF